MIFFYTFATSFKLKLCRKDNKKVNAKSGNENDSKETYTTVHRQQHSAKRYRCYTDDVF